MGKQEAKARRDAEKGAQREETWSLEGFEVSSQKLLRIHIGSLPFSIGRLRHCDLPLSSKMVSQQHSEILERDDSLWLRDLGSTNGTFVNGERVTDEHHLSDGDILHFADLEFRLTWGEADRPPAPAVDLLEEDRLALQKLWQDRQSGCGKTFD